MNDSKTTMTFARDTLFLGMAGGAASKVCSFFSGYFAGGARVENMIFEIMKPENVSIQSYDTAVFFGLAACLFACISSNTIVKHVEKDLSRLPTVKMGRRSAWDAVKKSVTRSKGYGLVSAAFDWGLGFVVGEMFYKSTLFPKIVGATPPIKDLVPYAVAAGALGLAATALSARNYIRGRKMLKRLAAAQN